MALIRCSDCGLSWSGLSYAHCSVCHSTFSSVTLFDEHRQHGHCYDLDGVYEVDDLYSTKEGHEKLAQKSEVLRKAREVR